MDNFISAAYKNLKYLKLFVRILWLRDVFNKNNY